jgi:hypothetical protein
MIKTVEQLRYIKLQTKTAYNNVSYIDTKANIADRTDKEVRKALRNRASYRYYNDREKIRTENERIIKLIKKA